MIEDDAKHDRADEERLNPRADAGAVKIRRIDHHTYFLARGEIAEELLFPALQESDGFFTVGQSGQESCGSDLSRDGAFGFNELRRITRGGGTAHGKEAGQSRMLSPELMISFAR